MLYRHRVRVFSVGLAWGSLFGVTIGAAALVWLITEESSRFTLPGAASIGVVVNWLGSNMGSSLLPFAIVFVLYARGVRRLKKLLSIGEAQADVVGQAEHWLEILESLTFGIGVLWTAIGMRAALLGALSNVDGQGSASDILARLVDGGILVALSTTIVGGAAGYLMRVIKSTQIGLPLRKYYESRDSQQADSVLAALVRIEGYLAARSGGAISDQTAK